jgi:hypothetical protein
VAPVRATPTSGPLPTPTAISAPDVLESVTPGPQKSLLLLGVTDAYAPEANLEACWVITFRSGVPQYYVLAFPLSASFSLPSLDGPRTLSQIHAEDIRLQLDHKFVREAIEARFDGLTLNAALVLDRSDLSALVGQLGGVPMNNQVLTGPALLEAYDAWPASTDLDRLGAQGDVLQRLFGLLVQRRWSAADLVTYAASIPRLAADESTVSALRAFAEGAPPLADNGLVWRTYGPELEAATAPSSESP